MSFFTKLLSNILKLDQNDIMARDLIFYDEFRSGSKFLCHKVFYLDTSKNQNGSKDLVLDSFFW